MIEILLRHQDHKEESCQVLGGRRGQGGESRLRLLPVE